MTRLVQKVIYFFVASAVLVGDSNAWAQERAQLCKVWALGFEVRALADGSFFETAVHLQRAHASIRPLRRTAR
jgi:hypothetical protein